MWKADFLRENSSFDPVCESIEEVFLRNNTGLFLIELPTESYCESNLLTIKNLLDNGYQGVYVSFQRPVKNINSWFNEYNLDLNKIKVLDGTNECKNKKEVSSPNVEDLFDKIYNSLQNIDSDKKFVFIDSLTTMELIKSESWSNNFSEHLINIKDDVDFERIFFIINVSKDLSEKKLVKRVGSHADGLFFIDNSNDGYSVKAVKPSILT